MTEWCRRVGLAVGRLFYRQLRKQLITDPYQLACRGYGLGLFKYIASQ